MTFVHAVRHVPRDRDTNNAVDTGSREIARETGREQAGEAFRNLLEPQTEVGTERLVSRNGLVVEAEDSRFRAGRCGERRNQRNKTRDNEPKAQTPMDCSSPTS